MNLRWKIRLFTQKQDIVLPLLNETLYLRFEETLCPNSDSGLRGLHNDVYIKIDIIYKNAHNVLFCTKIVMKFTVLSIMCICVIE